MQLLRTIQKKLDVSYTFLARRYIYISIKLAAVPLNANMYHLRTLLIFTKMEIERMKKS